MKKVTGILPLLKRWLGFAFGLSCIFVLTQDIQIFPRILPALRIEKGARSLPPPQGVESFFVDTDDAEKIEVWRMRPAMQTAAKRVALVFHGNGEEVDNTIPYLEWLNSIGLIAYSFDYRGYGHSSGWPSEAGLSRDASAVAKFISTQEQVSESELILIGNSIGTGIAASAAARIQPRALLLLSPYSSLPDVVRERTVIGYLAPFLWYQLDSAKAVSTLSSSCLIVARGLQDNIIPPKNGQVVFDAYRGSGYKKLLDEPQAGHNDLFWAAQSKLTQALQVCLSGSPS